MFVLDSSNSIGDVNWDIEKNFVKNFSASVRLDPSHVQIGVISFGSDVTNQFDLDQYQDHSSMSAAIDRISWARGNTNTGGALQYITEKSFKASHGGRAGVDNIVVFVTDGESTNKAFTRTEADKLHSQHNIYVYSIGVGDLANFDELKYIATEEEKVVRLADFNALKTLLNDLGNDTCLPGYVGRRYTFCGQIHICNIIILKSTNIYTNYGSMTFTVKESNIKLSYVYHKL